jgi:ankyrin repeat protein
MSNPWDDYEYITDKLRHGTKADWEELAQLLDGFPNGNDDWLNRAWITNAIDLCSIAAIEWMISKNVNLRFRDDEGYTPLHSAIERRFDDRVAVIELLVRFGANIDEIGLATTTPLLFALEMKEDDCAIALLRLGANPNIATVIDDYESAVEYAARTKHVLSKEIEESARRHDLTRKNEK